jgi:HEAT repeat protein
VRVTLIEEIGAKQQVEFLPDLAQLLSDGDKEVRDAAARAIGSFGWERMSGPMARLLRDKAEPVERRELVCRTLAETRRGEVAGLLVDLLDEPALRPAVLAGLKSLTTWEFERTEDWRTWWEANKNRTRAEWVASRTEALEKELEASRKRCTELEERASDAIIRALENRPDNPDGIGTAPLVAALDEPFAKVRTYAASTLAKLKAKEAGHPERDALRLGALVKKLSDLTANDASPQVRAECAAALGALGSEETVPVLTCALGDSNETVSAAAARALGRLKAASAVNPLLLALLSRSTMVRSSAAEALGQIGSAAAVDPLVELLGSDPEPGVRSQTARALGEIGDRRATAALEKALGDKSPAVRVYVIEAFGAFKTSEIAPKICAMLAEDGNPSVREAAAVALGKLGGAEALPLLIKLLDHPAYSAEVASATKAGQEKLAQLASSSVLAICQRDEKLCEPTAEALVRVGHPREAVTLYELLVQKLSDGKDDNRLTSVRVKLADVYRVLEQWTKAAPLLEELTKVLPTDAGLAEKYARALTELRRHSEAFRVYQNLAGAMNRDYWNERLVLLDMMLTDKKTAEVMKLVEESLQGKRALPDDVRNKLDVFRTRCVETMEEERKVRSREIGVLIREAATGSEETQAAARIKLKARAEEAYPQLVETLAGGDEKLRRVAAEVLRELTRQDFGYRPEAGPEENGEALKKWRAWLARPERGTMEQ